MGELLLESDAVSLALSTAAPRRRAIPERGTLTPREREVVRMFAGGRSPRQIADQLVLSAETVRTHLDRAAAKLGARSRVQLANWAARADDHLGDA